jgi:ribonuclease D
MTKPAIATRTVKRSTARKSRTASPEQRYRAFMRDNLNVHFLNTDDQVVQAVRQIKTLNPTSIALDFETARKQGSYGSLNGTLRLIQIGVVVPGKNEPVQFLIDCHRAEPAPVAELLADSGIEKHVHYVDFEGEWTRIHLGVKLTNVYDTCAAWAKIQKHLKTLSEEDLHRLCWNDAELEKASERTGLRLLTPRDFYDAVVKAEHDSEHARTEAARLKAAELLKLLTKRPVWEKHNNKLGTITANLKSMKLPKDEQGGFWETNMLTAGQVAYAAMDVAVMGPVVERTKEVAELLGIADDVKDYCGWLTDKVDARSINKNAVDKDDHLRVLNLLRHARTADELDHAWLRSLQMPVAAENRTALRSLYQLRRDELPAEAA